MVAIYSDVGAGDGISLTWRRHVHHPIDTGTYSKPASRSSRAPCRSRDARVRHHHGTPADMKLVLDAHGVQTEQETHDGKTVYRWH